MSAVVTHFTTVNLNTLITAVLGFVGIIWAAYISRQTRQVVSQTNGQLLRMEERLKQVQAQLDAERAGEPRRRRTDHGR